MNDDTRSFETLKLTPTASRNIEHFISYDIPIADCIKGILIDIAKGRLTGKPYSELSDEGDEGRVKDAFNSQSPVDEFKFAWKQLPSKSLGTKVLVVVVHVPENSVVISAGYIPRQPV